MWKLGRMSSANSKHEASVVGGCAMHSCEGSVPKRIGIGSKGYAIDYSDGVSKPMRVVAQTKAGAYLVCFFDGRTTQHTRGRDIKVKKEGEKREEPEESEGESPYEEGDKVWAREKGGEWMRGRVTEVFKRHGTALVKFYHETKDPSQNTDFSEISKAKQKPV